MIKNIEICKPLSMVWSFTCEAKYTLPLMGTILKAYFKDD